MNSMMNLLERFGRDLLNTREAITQRMIVHCFNGDGEGDELPAHYEARVGLIGRTGVGKTSLLLSLLGECEDEQHEDIIEIFRGNDSPTKVGTAIPTVYSLHDMESFTIIWRKEGNEDQRYDVTSTREVKEKLQRIRKEVEDIQERCPDAISVRDKLIIRLPKSRFRNSGVDDVTVSVIDLPGVDSYVKNEYRYTLSVFDYYFSICSAVVIVVQSTAIASLFDDAHVDEGGRSFGHRSKGTHWTQRNKDVLIVTTHDMLPGDYKKSERTPLTKEAITRGMYEEIMSDGGKADYNQTELRAVLSHDQVFPLEFGESVRIKKEGNRDLYDELQPIIEELKGDLRRKILQYSQEYRGIARIRHRLRRLLEMKREDLELNGKELQILTEEWREGDSDRKRLSDKVQCSKEKVEHDTELLKNLNKINDCMGGISVGWDSMVDLKDDEFANEYRDQLQEKMISVIQDGFGEDSGSALSRDIQRFIVAELRVPPSIPPKKFLEWLLEVLGLSENRRWEVLKRYSAVKAKDVQSRINKICNDTGNSIVNALYKIEREEKKLRNAEDLCRELLNKQNEAKKRHNELLQGVNHMESMLKTFEQVIRAEAVRVMRSRRKQVAGHRSGLEVYEHFIYSLFEQRKVESWLEV